MFRLQAKLIVENFGNVRKSTVLTLVSRVFSGQTKHIKIPRKLVNSEQKLDKKWLSDCFLEHLHKERKHVLLLPNLRLGQAGGPSFLLANFSNLRFKAFIYALLQIYIKIGIFYFNVFTPLIQSAFYTHPSPRNVGSRKFGKVRSKHSPDARFLCVFRSDYAQNTAKIGKHWVKIGFRVT